MTEDEAVLRMNKASEMGPEEGHMEADEILCDYLTSLGCLKLVDAFKDIKKWYA